MTREGPARCVTESQVSVCPSPYRLYPILGWHTLDLCSAGRSVVPSKPIISSPSLAQTSCFALLAAPPLCWHRDLPQDLCTCCFFRPCLLGQLSSPQMTSPQHVVAGRSHLCGNFLPDSLFLAAPPSELAAQEAVRETEDRPFLAEGMANARAPLSWED